MRKLLCLSLCLLCVMLPALAEEPPIDEAYGGTWVEAADFSAGRLTVFDPEDTYELTITADYMTVSDGSDSCSYPFQYDSDSGYWMLDHATPVQLTLHHGQLLLHNEHYLHIFRRPDAAPLELPSASPCVAYGGTWQAKSLYAFRSDYSDGFSCIMDFEALSLPTPEITLPAFASYEAIAAAWEVAVFQAASADPFMSQLLQIYDFVPHSSDTLLLVSAHGLILLERISEPTAAEEIRDAASAMANWWRLDTLSVGGIALDFAAFDDMDDELTIDEQGFALMGSDVLSLQLVDGNVCISSYPVFLLDDNTLVMTMTDGVEARFITEAAWYRQQIAGTWQLREVEIPALDMVEDVDPEALNVTLIIPPDGDVIRIFNGEEISCTLESTDDVIQYLLFGPENLTLTISSLSTLRISNESASFTLTFKPAE